MGITSKKDTGGNGETAFGFFLQTQDDFSYPPPEYKITTWPDGGFQLCPKCGGEGVVFKKHATTALPTEICPVCLGKMIISTKTGKPPE